MAGIIVLRNFVVALALTIAAHVFIQKMQRAETFSSGLLSPAPWQSNAQMASHRSLPTHQPVLMQGPGQQQNMPLDGLREMFEFAHSRDAWDSQHCDNGSPDADEPQVWLDRTKCIYPEQAQGPHEVVNTYKGDKLMNGGGADTDSVAAFDGWPSAASV